MRIKFRTEDYAVVEDGTFGQPVHFEGHWSVANCTFRGAVTYDDTWTTFVLCTFEAGEPRYV